MFPFRILIFSKKPFRNLDLLRFCENSNVYPLHLLILILFTLCTKKFCEKIFGLKQSDFVFIGTWSASTSPARSPSPSRVCYYPNTRRRRYGTTSLEQRSRSPSPTGGDRGPPPAAHHFHHQHPHQHSYPVLVTRRGHGRRLPPTPSKPSTLQLRPASINFPKLNASPTHCPPSQAQGQYCPLSFEQAVAIGRGGRVLPSPVPNGYKPGQRPRRHSDSDDDDWC